jgi:probable F420-dependent oxidoreductase
MDIGLITFPTEHTLPPDQLAKLIEDAGFESLFVCEHTHIPASRESNWADRQDLPSHYWQTLDPFIALTAAAYATSTLKLGTGICLVAQRDPITTAKSVATLERLSNSRFLFGVGAGWNVEEMANHGVDPKKRFGILREHVEAMRAIWSEQEAAYHGAHVDFEPIWAEPKPLRPVPVLVGGAGPKVIDRVLAYGDEWFPSEQEDVAELAGRIAELQNRAQDAGRGPVPVTLYGATPTRDGMRAWEEAGVTRALIALPPVAPDEGRRLIDEYAATVLG